jgi:hypothetical protein
MKNTPASGIGGRSLVSFIYWPALVLFCLGAAVLLGEDSYGRGHWVLVTAYFVNPWIIHVAMKDIENQ